MNKGRIFTIIGLLIVAVIIILPPIIHGYIYPNVGDDSAMHLGFLDEIQEDHLNPYGNVYTGFVITAYPLVWFSNITGVDIDVVFLWFNYIALLFAAWSIYFVIGNIANKKAGWFALIITVFCTQGLMFQFYYGVIFNMINIGIVFVWLLYFAVNYIEYRRKRYLIGLLGLSLLYSIYHTSGIYLPAFTAALCAAYIAYSLIKKRHIDNRLILVGFLICVFSGIGLWLLVPDVNIIAHTIQEALGIRLTVPIMSYLFGILSVTTMVILLVALFAGLSKLKVDWDKIPSKVKILFYILLTSTIVLAIPTFLALSNDPFRQALDFATIAGLLAAVIICAVLYIKPSKIVYAIVIVLMIFGLYHNVPAWLKYNNAMSEADIKAVEYINTLETWPDTFNCSTTVAPWIYQRFIHQQYTDEYRTEIYVERNKPMTPRSTAGNFWYLAPENEYPPEGYYSKIMTFTDDRGIAISVYVR